MIRPILLGAFALTLLASSSCTKEREARADCQSPKEDCRPELSYTLLDGKPLGEESLKGKVVMVNFWATWCGPCASELPSLDAVYRKHQDQGYVSVGVLTADQSADAAVIGFATAHKVSYPILRGTPEMEQHFALGDALPATFLYDKHGRLRAHWEGAVREQALDELVEKLLAE